MSLIRFHNVSKSFDSTPVLREVYFRLSKGDKVGLIGKNGVGKTTVLKLILGQEQPIEGTIDVDPGLSVGYFSQFSELEGNACVIDLLDALYTDIHATERELTEIAAVLDKRPRGAELERLLNRQAEVFGKMEFRGGWTYRNQIDTVLTKLGFSEEDRTRPVEQLSGGWRNRAALAEILLRNPDVLLMDEPTNYLDIEGTAWLEEWFRGFAGGLILVSHDRHFLDSVVNQIVEIENYHFQEYRGNFTHYVREKPTRFKALERQFEHEEELLAYEAEATADRQEAAKDPSRALKRKLANIRKRAEPRPIERIVTGLYKHLYVPSRLCRAESLSKSYGTQTLFRNLSFEVQQGDRIAILGPNGCGKTTLLNVLTGLDCADSGQVVWAKAADYSFYNRVLEQLDRNDSVTHAVNTVGLAYRAPRKQVNRFLSLLQFSEMDLDQRVSTLSGGQLARVALAQCLLSGAGVIVLDEPTNHLDLTSTQVMERALATFPGAVVVVSHDRFFIDKVATRLLVFDGNGSVEEVVGNWTIWQNSIA